MVNERYDDKSEGHEEGEYHFSDDQANYDMDAETPNEIPAETLSGTEGTGTKFKQSRRIVVGVVVFIILLVIVYKMLVPATTPEPTDFESQKSTTAAKMKAHPPVITPAPTQTVAQTPPVAKPAQPTAAEVAQKNIVDRLTVLEQQNTAVTSFLQTQYQQKIAENEAQMNQMRTELQELNTRIAGIEVAFHQLTKMLKTVQRPPATMEVMEGGPPPIRSLPPKMSYTVQAIIPGRAWLKSDSGDTVTVAEGDVLKDLGRITKIDPYDGIVKIDTGNRVITLSYGVNGD